MIVFWWKIGYSGEDTFPRPGCPSLKVSSFGSAKKVRRGVEHKQWLARIKQAKLYFEHSQVALDNVKVINMMPPTSTMH